MFFALFLFPRYKRRVVEWEREKERGIDERNSRSQTLTWSQQPGLSALEKFLDPQQLQVVLMAAGVVLDALGHLRDGIHRPCSTTHTHTHSTDETHIQTALQTQGSYRNIGERELFLNNICKFCKVNTVPYVRTQALLLFFSAGLALYFSTSSLEWKDGNVRQLRRPFPVHFYW